MSVLSNFPSTNVDKHASQHAAGGSDPITPSSIGAMPVFDNKTDIDLDTLTNVGVYPVVINNSDLTVTNAPEISNSAALIVEPQGGWSGLGRKQTFTSYISDNTYIRTNNFNGSKWVWSSWKKIATMADLPKRPNRNMLINWYFGDPVDTKCGYVVPPGTHYYDRWAEGMEVAGYTDKYYTAVHTPGGFDDQYQIVVDGNIRYVNDYSLVRGYTGSKPVINGWHRYGGTTKLNDGYMTLTGRGNNLDQGMDEYVHKYLRGKTVTMSLFGRGDFAIVSEDYTNSYLSNRLKSDEFDIVSLTFTVRSDADRFIYHIQPQDENSCDIIASKLELGNEQTLAYKDANGNWVLYEMPNKADVLAQCSNYNPETGEFKNELLSTTTDLSTRVSKSGDKMIGDLYIEKSSAAIKLNDTSSGGQGGVFSESNILWLSNKNIPDDSSNYRAIILRNSTTEKILNRALQLIDKTNNVGIEYNIFHTGNVTAGTSDITAGSSSLDNGAIYQVYS